MPGDEREHAAEGEVPVSERSEVDDRPRKGEAADDEQDAGDAGDHRTIPDGRVVEPIPPRPFLEHVFQGSKRHRHQDDAGIVGALEQRKIGLVDLHQKRDQDRYGDARNNVDVEEPAPVQRVGDKAANHRSERRRDRRDGADHSGGIDAPRTLEIVEGRGEDDRDHRRAQQSLKRPEHDHAFDVPGEPAQHARDGEACRRGGEQPARSRRRGSASPTAGS